MSFTLINNCTLIDGNGGDPKRNISILIHNNRISKIGPAATITIPTTDVNMIDAGGKYVLPGLIDTHVHIMMEVSSIQQMVARPFSMNFYNSVRYMRRTLDAGITTIRDAGGADLGVKQAVEQGIVEGPRMQISISVLGITGGHTDGWLPSGMTLDIFPEYPGNPSGICDGVEEVRKKVREVLRAGADIIKICSTGGVLSPTDDPEFTQFSPEELKVIVQEAAYRKGIKVMSHAQGAEGIKNAIRAGVHSIEHAIYLDDEAIELALAHGTYIVPTLLAPVAVIEIAEETGNMPEWGIRKAKNSLEAHRDSIARAYEAGCNISMGTDAGVMPHGTNLRELGLMTGIGMSPMEAIVATTKVAAKNLGWDDRIGTLEDGKLADLIMIESDPLQDIRSLENPDNISIVIKDGRIVKDIRKTENAK
ncbi:MAG: amidohydrolase family protein [Chloroflexi bacterium]|nr:MAG: amidohydrolase family protein [Chloroflexota bacterium]